MWYRPSTPARLLHFLPPPCVPVSFSFSSLFCLFNLLCPFILLVSVSYAYASIGIACIRKWVLEISVARLIIQLSRAKRPKLFFFFKTIRLCCCYPFSNQVQSLVMPVNIKWDLDNYWCDTAWVPYTEKLETLISSRPVINILELKSVCYDVLCLFVLLSLCELSLLPFLECDLLMSMQTLLQMLVLPLWSKHPMFHNRQLFNRCPHLN